MLDSHRPSPTAPHAGRRGCAPAWWLLLLGAALLCAPAATASGIGPPTHSGNRAKASGELRGKARLALEAVFLARFAAFTSWPAACADRPVALGVLGPDVFAGALARAANGKNANGHPLQVAHHANVTEVGPCEILFVSPRIQGNTLRSVLRALAGRPVLTVGHEPDFTRQGGGIGFFVEGGKLRFTINGGATAAAGVHLSARLRQLAHTPAERRGAR